MKTPDKADFRALAADTAVGFIRELPPPAQTDYCVFLTRMSRTPKVWRQQKFGCRAISRVKHMQSMQTLQTFRHTEARHVLSVICRWLSA